MAEAAAAYQAGRLDIAEGLCRQILSYAREQADALELLGILVAQSGRLSEAAQLLRRAIAARPNSPQLHFNHGNVLQSLGRPEAALESYERTLALQAGFAEAHNNRAHVLVKLGRIDEALQSFQHALALAPTLAEAWQGSAQILRELKRSDQALAHCERALALRPQFAEAHNTRGLVLHDLSRLNEAVRAFQAALAIRPDDAETHRNLGAVWQALDQHVEAVDCFEKALAIEPDFAWLAGTLLFAKLQLCDWRQFGEHSARLTRKIGEGRKVAQPFAALALVDSPRLQRRVAEAWVRDACPPSAAPSAASVKTGKIRLGYYSADFHNHATAYLAAELFETHDRERFELVAFSFGPAAADEMRTRVAAAFDEFIEVRGQSDREIAQLSRQRGIDIAIDQKGFTNYARTGIFAERAAPLQVNYLGYPGTLGAGYMDYLIADPVLIPAHSRAQYSEHIVYLPHSYQPNDRRRRIADTAHARAELGLPADAFVFCCFNNSFKITPVVFDSWMRILRQTPQSVLWLLADNTVATQNLQREAQARGIEPTRLIFAPRWPLAEHLARHRCADLCLDTLPYNAHTTASDSLWAGVPILTRRGESFAARVSASLLSALDLTELITDTVEHYESLAVELARQPERLAELRAKVAANRLVSPLFDAALLTQHLEAAYASMHARRLARLPPADIDVRLL